MILVPKIELVQQLETNVRAQIQTVAGVFQHMDETLLNTPASDGGWSIAQCLEHLNSYGRYYIPQIQKAIAQEHRQDAEEQVKSSWLGRYFTNMMKPSSTKHNKYKAFKDHIPALELDAYQVIAECMQQQYRLLEILDSVKHTHINTVKIKISIARLIRLRLVDVLQFIIAHNDRHLQQGLRQAQRLKPYDFDKSP
jgi:hypothetical protein